jgi:CrcB protein
LPVALVAATAGGVVGALGRYGLTEALPVSGDFPWTFFWINVLGSVALASLPLVAAVRRTPWLGVFLGTGVLGGFTTMSAASEQTVSLVDRGEELIALGYAGGTLLAALGTVWLVSQLVPREERLAAEANEVDE